MFTADMPQLPVTNVVTPSRRKESARGTRKMPCSICVWTSMKPGARVRRAAVLDAYIGQEPRVPGAVDHAGVA